MADYDTQPYVDAFGHLRDVVRELHVLMNDPFKAPEQTIEAIPEVQAAMWNAQVEYVAMMRS